ncbi:amidohydrolase family protein [Mesorhizobium sp. VK25A]|uniref:Amidohydrolase family protein n=1 Tax=Mesorhizobium vachelliae TaxID=3072309 RepID=A0ABU4ZZH4_9HYPH|nr:MULTISPECIES: amidohydrolase family protein [unclassified Mesorhizobium]MDX8530820.1 amidohydrolase family protein [Mesorhizobium sp. VK25D]MDX8543429.1 amidohydrolase family protein [Mesorhizobium sp. VK25A]
MEMSEDQGFNGGMTRRALMAMAAAATATAITPVASLAQGNPVLRNNEEGPYDLVIRHGRVIDPETGLDAVRDVGIKDNRIAAISESPLQGAKVLQAEGQVVAPGFIDLHAHGQQLPAAWVQAFDGVTTALELESGLLPISRYYDLTAKEGRPINYGASVAWTYARIAEKEGEEPDGTLSWFQGSFSKSNWQNSLATDEELDNIIARVESGLQEGGLGIGINAGYAPGCGRKEYHRLAELAARYGVPTYTHVRYGSVKEPRSAFEAFEELVALSAVTGAHMHVCHVNSMAASDMAACVGLLKSAQARGLSVTVESYPYGAASTLVGAETFRGSDWTERWGVTGPSAMELNGRPLTQAEIDELQQSAPGTVVVMHFLSPDKSETDRALLDLAILYPGGSIASDAVPWLTKGGELIEGDIWPLPEDAYAHPRSTGTYSRVLSQYVRERKVLSLSEALGKMSLEPARVLQTSVPQMLRKGRLQVGADADIVVFDPATVQDNATFVEPARLSTGYRHVVVNGVPIIEEAKRIADARPGRPIRRQV